MKSTRPLVMLSKKFFYSSNYLFLSTHTHTHMFRTQFRAPHGWYPEKEPESFKKFLKIVSPDDLDTCNTPRLTFLENGKWQKNKVQCTVVIQVVKPP